jgi:predicted RNA-binding protein with PIN domain
MPEPTLYLFDGFNLLHAGRFGSAAELTDSLASYVALRGARGVLVFDGIGADEELGPLQVRWARDADALLERLAAEHRGRERVCLVSSDALVRSTTGPEVAKMSSATLVEELAAAHHREQRRSEVGDRIDPDIRARLDRLRRRRTSED